MKSLIIAYLLFLFVSLLTASSASQTDWSQGPNHLGPYPSFSGRFLESDGIRWSYPEVLHLLDVYPVYYVDGDWLSPRVVCFDINKDGLDDIIPISTNGDILEWVENLDSGLSFEHHIISDEYLYPTDVFPVDLDLDGDIDIVSCHSSGTAVSWWENTDGEGINWTEHVIKENQDWPYSIAAADFDGDGDIDVAVSEGFMDGDVLWYENLDGLGTNWNYHTIISAFSNSTNSISAADIDLDGDIDLFWVKYNDHKVVWLENQLASGSSWSAHEIDILDKPRFIIAEDIDSDGYPDAVVAAHYKTMWYRNDGQGSSWTSHVIGDYGGIGTSVHAADIDCDGDSDLFSSHYAGVIRCWINSGGPYTNWPYRDMIRSFDKAYSVHSAFMNNDGFPDIVGASFDLDQIAWWNYHDFSYTAYGELTSSVLSLGTDPAWEYVDWDASTPPGTQMMVLVRSANSMDSLTNWSDTLYSPSSLSGILEDSTSLLQYKVLFTSTDPDTTAILNNIIFFWTNVSISESNSATNHCGELLPFSPNPVTGSVTVGVQFFDEIEASIFIFDTTGRMVFTNPVTLYDPGYHSVYAGEMEPGVYFCKLVSGETHLLRSFVVVE